MGGSEAKRDISHKPYADYNLENLNESKEAFNTTIEYRANSGTCEQWAAPITTHTTLVISHSHLTKQTVTLAKSQSLLINWSGLLCKL